MQLCTEDATICSSVTLKDRIHHHIYVPFCRQLSFFPMNREIILCALSNSSRRSSTVGIVHIQHGDIAERIVPPRDSSEKYKNEFGS
ncbi:hypothetical protein VTL71DRAFT_3673 [Oculimacula yallundae]|uniref:Uncharacterized protein n=1 Tax=Oculimacula yallundae TaxID=86028 RepID=A0ABR4C4W0_9HELO